MKSFLLALCCTGFAFSGTAQERPRKTNNVSIDGLWYLRALLAADSATGVLPSISINSSTRSFSGNTGCNRMEGKLEKTDSTLRFMEPIAMTRRYCSGYDETAFLLSLKKANRYRVLNGDLILYFDATELSRWTRKPVKPTINRRA
jgi:hypothetical protein